jgi:potassium-transporting ATPase KdpC subunit
MLLELRPAIVMMLLMTALTGIAYPLAMTGIAQVLFPEQANGSLIVQGGTVIGSALIGQRFDDPRYFHPRPSYAGDGYAADHSGGSNLAPTNRALVEAVRTRAAALTAAMDQTPVPIDLVTASGSGLDPDLSPAAALFQAPRVARARSLPLSAVQALVREHTEGRDLGLLGERRVNVLLLNLALDRLAAERPSPGPAPARNPDG